MAISTLFLDLGKVLVDFDFNIAFDRVAERSPLDLAHLQSKAYSEYPLINDYESGRISTPRFFTVMQEHFQFEGTVQELEQIWCDVFTPLEQNLNCLRELVKHYPVALVSNTSDAHIRFLETRHDFFKLFKRRIYSYRVGCMKPDAAIYKIALKEMRAKPEESLFVDDLAANVAGAEQLGFQAVLLQAGRGLTEALKEYRLQGL